MSETFTYRTQTATAIILSIIAVTIYAKNT